jgi:hypothetical protein
LQSFCDEAELAIREKGKVREKKGWKVVENKELEKIDN